MGGRNLNLEPMWQTTASTALPRLFHFSALQTQDFVLGYCRSSLHDARAEEVEVSNTPEEVSNLEFSLPGLKPRSGLPNGRTSYGPTLTCSLNFFRANS